MSLLDVLAQCPVRAVQNVGRLLDVEQLLDNGTFSDLWLIIGDHVKLPIGRLDLIFSTY